MNIPLGGLGIDLHEVMKVYDKSLSGGTIGAEAYMKLSRFMEIEYSIGRFGH